MIILRARALSNGEYEVSDHLGKRRIVNEGELKAVIKSESAIIIGVELNGRNQVKEKKISDAEEALWKIYVQVKLFGGDDGYEESEEDDTDDYDSWRHYKYYTDLQYFWEKVSDEVEEYFS